MKKKAASSTDPLGIEFVLPSFIPVVLERGLPGYAQTECLEGENRLTPSEVRSLLTATTLLGTLEHAGNRSFDTKLVRSILTKSLLDLSEISSDEKNAALALVDSFFNYKIIRADHPFDDWICEALWEQFQSIPYVYPSAMSNVISYGLMINKTLEHFALLL